MGTGRPGEWAPGRTKSKTEREKGWENDSRKKARITEKQKGRETNGRERKERQSEIFLRWRALFIIKLAMCVWGSQQLWNCLSENVLRQSSSLAVEPNSLAGETRAWGPAGGDQMAGCGRDLFSVFQ